MNPPLAPSTLPSITAASPATKLLVAFAIVLFIGSACAIWLFFTAGGADFRRKRRERRNTDRALSKTRVRRAEGLR